MVWFLASLSECWSVKCRLYRLRIPDQQSDHNVRPSFSRVTFSFTVSFLAVVPSLPLPLLNFITVAQNSLELEDLPKTCSANALFHSIIFIKPGPYLLPLPPPQKSKLLHCGYVVNHISHWHVCLTVGKLMDCFPALNLQKGPGLIEFALIAWYVVAFRMVKTINIIA